MDTIPSSEFRKRYAGLHVDTLVTVNGHVIGRWMPIGLPEHVKISGDGEVFVDRPPEYVDERFNTRPFTPVPKARQRPRGPAV